MPIKIAALASFFILVNSAAGLVGFAVRGTLDIPWKETVLLGSSVLLGGQVGIRFGIKRLSPKGIRLGTAVLVFIVGLRILMEKGFEAL